MAMTCASSRRVTQAASAVRRRLLPPAQTLAAGGAVESARLRDTGPRVATADCDEGAAVDDAEGQRADPEPWAIFERSKPGWYRATGDFPDLYIGCGIDDHGAVIITRLVVLGQGTTLNSKDLRRIPLRRLEVAVNAPNRRGWAGSAPQGLDPLRELEEVLDQGPEHYAVTPLRTRLARPKKSEIDDDFYRQVAVAYRHYVQLSNKPAVEIALEAGVPIPTARRWINSARQRGHLSPGERGRATSGQLTTDCGVETLRPERRC